MYVRRCLGALTALSIVLALGGCATKKFVRSEVGTASSTMGDRIDEVQSQVEETQSRLSENEQKLEDLSVTARDALQRAVAAGKLAEGKLVYETVMAGDGVNFGFESSELSATSMEFLNLRCGIPLHRMAAISYGESAPIADNQTREGRIKNRRVALVVLK